MHVTAPTALPPLTATQQADFFCRARQLGHQPEDLVSGQETRTYLLIPTMEEVRLLSNAPPEQARLRYPTFYQSALLAQQRLGQQGEAFQFAQGPLVTSDSLGLETTYPCMFRSSPSIPRR